MMYAEAMRARSFCLWNFTWRVLSWWEGRLIVAGFVFIASAYALARGAPWAAVVICAPLAFVLGFIIWRATLTAMAERQMSRSHLQLGRIGGPTRIPPGAGYVASTIPVTNARRNFPNACHNVRANLFFTFMRTGEKRKVAGMFVTTDGQSITSEPVDSVSLEMAHSTSLVAFVTDRLNRNFTTFSTWPFDPHSESCLGFGECELGIVITGDNEGTVTVKYILQLSPDLSSSWTPVRTMW